MINITLIFFRDVILNKQHSSGKMRRPHISVGYIVYRTGTVVRSRNIVKLTLQLTEN